jgi:signal transduction histidine kinase
LTVAGLGVFVARGSVPLDVPELLAWILASLLADLMYVRIGKSITLSMSLPVLLAAGFLHAPGVTGLIAFLGCLDPRELQGKTSIERILFNRSQIALAAMAASLTMHWFPSAATAWPWVIAIFAAGLLADCLVNVAFVAVSTSLSGRASLTETIAGLWGSEPKASFALYASMCLVAPLLLLVYRDWGPWALLACTLLLLPFRLALSRIESLGLTARVVRAREAALADAEASVSVQRREERLLLAGDLHDEVLPALFKVHLMGEVLRQDLASGRLLDLDEDLPDLLEATRAAQHAVRQVVGDLRTTRSVIRNVARAIRSSAEQMEKEGTPRIDLRLAEVQVADPAGLVLLQVAREAMVNASRYSEAHRISVQLEEEPSGVACLTIVDDGNGFDLSSVDDASHFGLQLMRERVEAVGGELEIVSSKGLGTVVSARLPG